MPESGLARRNPASDPGQGPDADWTVGRLLRRRADECGERPFVRMRDDGEWITFADLLTSAEDFARRLAAVGVRAGQVVPTLISTSPELLAAWFGISLLGAADMPINVKYRGASLAGALRLSGASAVVVENSLLPRVTEVLSEVPDLRTAVVVRGSPAPSDTQLAVVGIDELPADPCARLTGGSYQKTASVLLTSGTTGPSKGVMMPHAQVITHSYQSVDLVGLGPDDIYYSAHPMFHMAGKFSAVIGSMQAGCRIVLAPEFGPSRWLSDIRDAGATVSLGHGPLLELIFRQPERPDDADNPLRAIAAGGVPGPLAKRFERRFGLRLAETYGMSELNIVAASAHDEARPTGSAGRIVSDLYEVRIIDPDTDRPLPTGQTGEITVRPKVPWTTSIGYLGMPERTVEVWRNLWMHTSDMGRLDNNGFLFFAERTGERIRRRAENISAYDIEAAVSSYHLVVECAAVGVPSELDGDDDVKVYVVTGGGQAIDYAELLRHCGQRLPPFMVPRYIEVIDALPRTPTAKIQKTGLRARGVTPETWDRRAAGIDLRTLLAESAPAGKREP